MASSSESAAIRAGLVGFGNSGRFYHLPHLLNTPGIDLRWIATGGAQAPPPELRTPSVEHVQGWETAVGRGDVDLVVVATPHHLHFPVARAALEQGAHVLVEKPATIRTSELDELLVLAAERRRVLLSHQQRRFEADFVALQEIVRSGELGDVWQIGVSRGHQGDYVDAGAERPHSGSRPLDWARTRSGGGGVARVIGPHPVDHLLTLAGSPVTTVAGRALHENGEDVEHFLAIDVEFASGALGRVEIFRRSGIAPPRFVVRGTRGAAVAGDGTTLDVQLYDGTRRTVTGLPAPGILCAEIYQDLVAAILTGAPPRVPAADARA